MTLEELKQKHSEIPNEFFCSVDMHTKLSVKFALELLEELLPKTNSKFVTWYEINDKISELKNYYK